MCNKQFSSCRQVYLFYDMELLEYVYLKQNLFQCTYVAKIYLIIAYIERRNFSIYFVEIMSG